MLREIVIGVALLGLTTGGALAASGGGMEQAEITAVQSARVSPQAAIQAAEARGNGRAVSFGLEKTDTVNAYQVTLAGHSGLAMVQVDPNNGSVISVTPVQSDALAADGLPAQAIGDAVNQPVSLAQAVQTAENQLGGPALEAGYAVDHGRMAIEVDVVRNGGSETVQINPQNGQIAQAAMQGEPAEDTD